MVTANREASKVLMEPCLCEEQEGVRGWELMVGISHRRVCSSWGTQAQRWACFTIHITVLRSLCHHHHHKHLCPTLALLLKWANASHRQTLSLQHSPGTGSIISPSWSGNTGATVVLVVADGLTHLEMHQSCQEARAGSPQGAPARTHTLSPAGREELGRLKWQWHFPSWHWGIGSRSCTQLGRCSLPNIILGPRPPEEQGEPQAALGCPCPPCSPAHALTHVSLEGRGSGVTLSGWAAHWGVPRTQGSCHLPKGTCLPG